MSVDIVVAKTTPWLIQHEDDPYALGAGIGGCFKSQDLPLHGGSSTAGASINTCQYFGPIIPNMLLYIVCDTSNIRETQIPFNETSI